MSAPMPTEKRFEDLLRKSAEHKTLMDLHIINITIMSMIESFV